MNILKDRIINKVGIDGKYHYVYALLLKSGKSYVGVRSCKCNPHDDNYYGSSKYIKPTDVLSKLVVGLFNTRAAANAAEINWHQLFDVAANPKFANKARMTSVGFCMAGKKFSEEHKAKLSANHARLSGEKNPMYGKHFSAEARRKMGAARKGKTHTAEARRKMSVASSGANNGMYGKTLSAATKAKISAANKGRKRTEESKRKMSDQRIYHFFNVKTEESVFSKYLYLRTNSKKLFRISSGSIQNLKCGNYKQVKSWIYVGVANAETTV